MGQNSIKLALPSPIWLESDCAGHHAGQVQLVRCQSEDLLVLPYFVVCICPSVHQEANCQREHVACNTGDPLAGILYT